MLDDSTLIDEVVSMGRCIGLKVESEDIHELLKLNKIELNMEELQHLQEGQKKLWLIICRLMKMR